MADRDDRDDRTTTAAARITALRQTHSNKPSLLRRMDEAGL